MSEDTVIADAADEDWPLFALIREYCRPEFPYVGLSLLTGTVANSLSNVDMFVIGIAFDAMFNGQSYALPLVPTGWIPAGQRGQLAFTVVLLLGLKLIDVTFGITEEFSWNVFAQRGLHRIRVDAFDAVQRLEMRFFDERRVGEILSVLNSDVNEMEEVLTQFGETVLFGTVLAVSSLVYMGLLNPRLTLVAVVVLPLIAVVNWWFSRLHERYEDVVRERMGRLNALVETNVSGIPVIKAFGAERYESDRVADASRRHYTAARSAHVVFARHQPALQFLAGLAFLSTFVIGTSWVVDGAAWVLVGEITAGELIPFLYYTLNLVVPVQALAASTQRYKRGKAVAKRVLGIQQLGSPHDDTGTPLREVDGRVAYSDVSFGYPGVDETVIDGVSLDVAAGETVGLVGTTGAGKSTLVKLLLRFYSPDDGEVRLDGHPLDELTVSSVRDAVGYVSQDPFLFTGTIHENVVYGASDCDRADVVEAAREAEVHGFVTDLEDGYETQVGERGTRLSGGQRQRIAIARAILSDPPVLVFDEATSHVDNYTEALIQRSIARVASGRTTFVIAHRLSTVRDADRILHLDDGRVTERGTHAELLAEGGDYAELWSIQVGETTGGETGRDGPKIEEQED